MKNELIARRSLLKAAVVGAVAVSVTGFGGRANAAPALVPLTADDPTGKALAYSEDSAKVDESAHSSHKSGQTCTNCIQYQGKAGDARGGCSIFSGKSVNAHGWCSVWAMKAGA